MEDEEDDDEVVRTAEDKDNAAAGIEAEATAATAKSFADMDEDVVDGEAAGDGTDEAAFWLAEC